MSTDTLGARLRRARAHAALTQQQVADAVGIAREGVAQYESGAKTPTLDTCAALAAAVGVRAGWLAWGEGRSPMWDGNR